MLCRVQLCRAGRFRFGRRFRAHRQYVRAEDLTGVAEVSARPTLPPREDRITVVEYGRPLLYLLLEACQRHQRPVRYSEGGLPLGVERYGDPLVQQIADDLTRRAAACDSQTLDQSGRSLGVISRGIAGRPAVWVSTCRSIPVLAGRTELGPEIRDRTVVLEESPRNEQIGEHGRSAPPVWSTVSDRSPPTSSAYRVEPVPSVGEPCTSSPSSPRSRSSPMPLATPPRPSNATPAARPPLTPSTRRPPLTSASSTGTSGEGSRSPVPGHGRCTKPTKSAPAGPGREVPSRVHPCRS
ncbi:hypothetical protein EV643_1162 [Kribbella sp. VKM Ac-2527]|uniref:Uncharacterized protein n=1 Tax=Kribbella caucasensis TaxID=2512215 RepID=A0A4R6K772_9ACTN|nr:hypothetical protein EV643_1162 [Kribbella sp. VKM Ac-2527]